MKKGLNKELTGLASQGECNGFIEERIGLLKEEIGKSADGEMFQIITAKKVYNIIDKIFWGSNE